MGRHKSEHRRHFGAQVVPTIQPLPSHVGDLEKRRSRSEYGQDKQTTAQRVRLCASHVDYANGLLEFAHLCTRDEKERVRPAKAQSYDVHYETGEWRNGTRHKALPQRREDSTH